MSQVVDDTAVRPVEVPETTTEAMPTPEETSAAQETTKVDLTEASTEETKVQQREETTSALAPPLAKLETEGATPEIQTSSVEESQVVQTVDSVIYSGLLSYKKATATLP